MTGKEPLDHILRPQLPWRSGPGITECGYDASKIRALTRTEFLERHRQLGERRMAMLTCMTCYDTAKRWGTWDDDPRKALQREIEWECRWRGSDEHGVRLRDELLAIAELIERHRDEFDEIVTAAEQRRAWNDMKSAAKAKSTVTPPRGNL